MKQKTNELKIKGLKKAVEDYQLGNEGEGSPFYARLMYDANSSEIWTDCFCSLGRNEWKEYHSNTIVNLGSMMAAYGIPVNMANVKKYIPIFFAE